MSSPVSATKAASSGFAGFVLAPGAFRIALATAVVVSHLSRFSIGGLAVLLFFYLSGYWTARIWAEKFQSSQIARFYAARYLRIAPLFLLATLGAAFVRHMPLHLVNFTLLGVASTHTDPTGVAWSLDIELQFYLLLPFVAYGLAGRRRIPTLLGIAVLTVVGWYLETRYQLHTVAKYLPIFALGVLTFSAQWKPSVRTAALSLTGFLAMTVLTAFTPFLVPGKSTPFDPDAWSFVWLLPLLPYIAHSLTLRSSRLDRHLGNLSYPIYLVHFAIITVVLERFGASPGGKALAVALTCVVALTVYWLVDRPVDRWRVRLTETPRTS